jgi:fermentation-respiration switch protein FrsA (DUF1100 family)
MRMTYIKKQLFYALLFTILISPSAVRADGTSYGFIEATRGEEEVHIHYRGPSGEKDAICDINTLSCRGFDPDTDPFRVSDLLKGLSVTVAPDAESAVLKLGTTQGAAYAFIDFTDGIDLSLIPLKEPSNVTKAMYSRDSGTVVFLGRNILQTYTAKNKKIVAHTIAVPQSLTLVSPSGDYISWYSYTSDEHMIVDLETGELISIRSRTPAYLEIAENGEWGIFKEVVNDEDALRMVTFPDGKISTVYDEGAFIDDYLIHQDVAYLTTNERSPLSWSLIAYDPEVGTSKEIDRDIAYTDYMKSVGEVLLYYKVSGNRGDVYAYRPDTGKSARLSGQDVSSYKPVSVRKEREIGDVNGVILDDGSDANQKKPLIVWLHGGPERQTSIGYHPYLSYGVYDEMLERFVKGGARVAKLDYTGSTGYGARFQKGLIKKIGVADVADVKEAIDDLTDDYETSDVYLIGNSYGGYLALKTLVEEPRLVDGAASINGVTDWDTLIGTNYSSIFAPMFGGVPSKKTAKYYKKAEIMDNLDAIPARTPIVIAYGEKDTTVPPSQSKIFIAGAENDKHLTKLVFEDEEHILREQKTLDRLCMGVADAFDLSDRYCSQ